MKTDARVSWRSLGTALGRDAGAGDSLDWKFDGEGPSGPSCADCPGLGLVLEELGFRPSWAHSRRCHVPCRRERASSCLLQHGPGHCAACSQLQLLPLG